MPATGRTKPRSKDVGMRHVAKLAGVSPITVSRTLRSPDSVAQATRAKVEKAIAELNYLPNLIAGALSNNQSRIVAVIVPNIANSVFASTLQGMTDRLHTAGYQMMIGYSGYSVIEEEALVSSMLARRPEGIVLTGHTHTHRTRELLLRARMPVIEMWSLPEKPLDIAIGFSNFDAARAMTLHIANKGYRRIGYIGGLIQNNDRTSAREAGYKAALSELGLSIESRWMRRAPFEFSRGGDAIDDLLSRNPEVEAVFTAADTLAIGALLRCVRRGWQVPTRVGLAGFDDTALSSLTTPPLTTVRVPQYEIGVAVAARILEELTGNAPSQKVDDLGFEIVERESL